ncbi:hypothetical protein J2W91_002061, partial [Paenibacillus amylolyticus]|nr:hypothetical protein [Paenibacillus amylolyticus]
YLVLFDKVKDVVLPLVLSFMFVFYIYLFTIIAAYEVLFIRLSFMKTIDESLRFRLKIRIFLFCNLSISRVSNFIQRSKIMQVYVRSTDDISDLFRNYKYHSNRKNIQEGSNIS